MCSDISWAPLTCGPGSLSLAPGRRWWRRSVSGLSPLPAEPEPPSWRTSYSDQYDTGWYPVPGASPGGDRVQSVNLIQHENWRLCQHHDLLTIRQHACFPSMKPLGMALAARISYLQKGPTGSVTQSYTENQWDQYDQYGNTTLSQIENEPKMKFVFMLSWWLVENHCSSGHKEELQHYLNLTL